jgi:hypothetical protein
MDGSTVDKEPCVKEKLIKKSAASRKTAGNL